MGVIVKLLFVLLWIYWFITSIVIDEFERLLINKIFE